METARIAELDERIAQVETSLATLRVEITAMDRSKPGFLRVRDLIVIGERSLAKLRAERAQLGEGK